MGVLLALDDFGTGHSSLAYLQRYHFDIIKIDRSFVRMIGSDMLSGHIVDTVIALAKRLDMITWRKGLRAGNSYSICAAIGWIICRDTCLAARSRCLILPGNG